MPETPQLTNWSFVCSVEPTHKQVTFRSEEPPEPPKCSECGAPMVVSPMLEG